MIVHYQMGKAGLTDNFIQTVRSGFVNHKIAKIALLKTSTRDKEQMKKMAEEICKKLEDDKSKYVYKVIGFTMVISKFRNKKKKQND